MYSQIPLLIIINCSRNKKAQKKKTPDKYNYRSLWGVFLIRKRYYLSLPYNLYA